MGVLRKLFGPSRQEVWQQLSTEIGGHYTEGGYWKGDKVEATHGEWIVTLDRYTTSTGKSTQVYTRMRAPYVNPDGFRFTVYRRGFFSDVAKWFGMQDVEIGDREFDHQFIIKGTSTTRLRDLFSNRRIRELIALQPQVYFTVKDDEGLFGPRFPEKVDELSFHCEGVVNDLGQLKQLYELFAETLDQLCRLGAAYEDAPGLKL
jgi:hypothetical protein